jgi:hypothetical protein
MGKVMCEISMSLDGFIRGPNVRVGNGMGDRQRARQLQRTSEER